MKYYLIVSKGYYGAKRRTYMEYTKFGKFVRKLRIDRCEYLKDMADKLGVKPSFLSMVETGNKSIPASWYQTLISIYSLNEEEQKELKEAIEDSINSIKINLKNASDLKRQTSIVFARSFDDMSPETAQKILELLEKDN